MTTQLTEEERLEWEAEKYSNRTLSVRVLSSGRVVICQSGLEIARVWSEADDVYDMEDYRELLIILQEMCSIPLEEYTPPRRSLEVDVTAIEAEFTLKI